MRKPEWSSRQTKSNRINLFWGLRWTAIPRALTAQTLHQGYSGYNELYLQRDTLDPAAPDTVYISTNVEPRSGRPLLSKADRKQHYEIFKGTTADGGAAWKWTPITTDSSADNLRPIVAEGSGDNAILLWLRGTYRAYTDYNLEVVGISTKRPKAATVP